jgi:hypothetical protein
MSTYASSVDRADVTLTLVSGDYRAASPQLPSRRVITLPGPEGPEGPDGPALLRAAAGRIAVTEDAVPWAVSQQRPLTVIDLRRAAEIWHRPTGGSPDDLQVLRMPLNDPRFAALPWAEHTPGAFRRHYRSLARRALPQVDAALDALASGRDVLITCQLGRDRTAIVVASVLARLGAAPAVTRDDGDLTYRELALRPQWLSRVLAERGETLEGFLLRNQAAHAAFHDLFDGDTPVALRSVGGRSRLAPGRARRVQRFLVSFLR